MQTFLQTWWSSKIRRVVYFHCLAYDRGVINAQLHHCRVTFCSEIVWRPAGLSPAPDSAHRWRQQEVISEFTCWAEQTLLTRWVNLLFTHLQTFWVFPAAWSQSVTSNINKRLKHVPVVFRVSELDATEVSHSDQSDDFMWKTAWAKRK